ncbi:hypothetical protein AB0758_07320 [Tolypothrix bouteillei VB521301_2]|uniref:hypothetical protein n=1 Tax=Tolypothrix bouteillei TaxID=1246981 RepID=UPI000514738A
MKEVRSCAENIKLPLRVLLHSQLTLYIQEEGKTKLNSCLEKLDGTITKIIDKEEGKGGLLTRD